MTKRECIESYDKQGYRLLEIPINPQDPKALTRTGWNTEPTNLNIGENNLFAVVQEDNKFVIDIDDVNFNEVLKDFFDKTLVVQTGNGGRHYYFKDNVIRTEQHKIRITKLYKNGKEIGDIRAVGKIKDGVEGVSYVVGCGSSYIENGIKKEYKKISSTDQVLEIDGYDVLKILSDNGITTKEKTPNIATKGKDLMKGGVKVGNIHDALRTTALSWLGFTKDATYEQYEKHMKAWNQTNEQPEHEPKFSSDIQDFWEFYQKEKEEKLTGNKKSYFTVSRKSKNYSVQVLGHEIQQIRPITLLDDGTRMILVYLPVKVQEIDKDGNLGESKFENKAFFVINGSEKRILPADHNELKENYKINVLPSGFELRWNLADLNKWLEESEKSNPKELYDLQQTQTEKYLDFEHGNDYVYYNLWNIATYFYEVFGAFPYNDYTGTKRAGKTKALEFQSHVCFNAILTPDISGSALFRTIEGTGATVLLDETEAFKREKNEQAQQVRTLLLEGFLKDKLAIRTEGSSDNGFTVTNFNLYSPKSMGHINTLDDVLGDRCIELLMLRSKNIEKLNTWPTKRDAEFVKLRNFCYRLFLDYGEEIRELQEEARKLLNVSGRELQVWTPIITMALFFENHGCIDLVKSIQEKITKSSGQRQITDEQGNKELKVLRFINEKILSIVNEVVGQKKNPPGWIPISEIFKRLADGDTAKEYEINLEFYKQKQLTEDLHRIGFTQERKSAGYSWEITDETVQAAKDRLGMIDPKTYKCTTCNSEWKYTIKTVEELTSTHEKDHVIAEVKNE